MIATLYVGCVCGVCGLWILDFGFWMSDFGLWILGRLVEFSVWRIRLLDFGLTKFEWIWMLPNQLSRQADPGRQISGFGHYIHISYIYYV